MAPRLGELLVRKNLITPEQLQAAMVEQKKKGGRLGTHLTGLGYMKEDELLQFLSKQYGVPAVNLSEFELDEAIVRMVKKETLEKHTVIPINRAGNTLILAMADPSNLMAIDEVKFTTNYNVEVVVASEPAIFKAIAEIFAKEQPKAEGGGGGESALDSLDVDGIMSEFGDDIDYTGGDEDDADGADLSKGADDAPIVRMVNAVLIDAIKKKASDIHVEIYEKAMRIRLRIDGVLQEVMRPPMKMRHAIVSRLKIMANLDIAERRLPQDGRIKLKLGGGKEMDFRVSVLPCLFGEKVVMRLLDKSNLQLDMTKLGFGEEQLVAFKDSINKPFGMVLVTGPTGSGKTTTLYSALSELNEITENISTAEDPVEFNLLGINQVNVRESIGLSFAAALRSFLRQDPDIIMVGEIRDFETGEIAIKAALTGHLVLSTLHTNDAPSTVSRLLNMGVEPFLVAASVNCIVAQRLARKVCQECRTPIKPDVAKLIELGMEEGLAKSVETIYDKGSGCEKCNGNGYKGRVALYEVMVMTDALKEYVLAGASTLELKQAAIRGGFMSLRQSGLYHLREGRTSISEVLNCSVSDNT